MDVEIIKRMAWDEKDYAVNIRRDFHKYPELSLKEFRTSQKIQEELKKLGIEYTVYDKTTAVVGLIRGAKKGKTVALRADMDALPITEKSRATYQSVFDGVMHACGHDGHMAILLGTAKILSGMRDKLYGNVKLLFQPAEETVGGAETMINLGCMNNPKVDYVFGLHVDASMECGMLCSKANSFNASSDVIEIIIKGKKAHGAYPELGIDAIYTAANIIVSLQSLISRRLSAHDSAVLTVGKIEGGTAYNVVADDVRMGVMLRATEPKVREQLKEWIIKTVKFVAESNNAKGIINIQPGYAAIVNDKECVDLVEIVSREMLEDSAYRTVEYPFLGVEDFSYFLHKAKGAYYQLGCANCEKGILSQTHTSEFEMDEDALVYGIMMQVGIVCHLIGQNNECEEEYRV